MELLCAEDNSSLGHICQELNHALFFFLRFYLFINERQRQREKGTDTGRGRSTLHAGSPMWELIPGLQDHALG